MGAQNNVLGHEIGECSCKPLTGWYRDGHCNTDDMDRGSHTVCAIVTEDFLQFAKSKGNDLMTPAPHFNFPGLKPGDSWCVCTYLVGRFESRTSMSCRFRSNQSQGTGNHSTRTPRRPSNLIIHSLYLQGTFEHLALGKECTLQAIQTD